jgi:TrmH family RNA methyltransferase
MTIFIYDLAGQDVSKTTTMKTITSRDNPLFKSAKKLVGSARERGKAGQTLLDGTHLIAAHLQAGGEPDALLVAVSAQGHPEIRDLIKTLPLSKITWLSDELFREISTVETPTGIAALIRIPSPNATEKGSCVLLEDIQDPGNLGSILRSAAAAGIRQIHLSTGCADAWSPKVLRAGMGAHFHLSIQERSDLVKVAQVFPGKVVATRLLAETSLFDLDLTGQVAFVIGNEGAGISAQLLAAAKEQVAIPMPGEAESLNAAAAAAICFFERVRQLRA